MNKILICLLSLAVFSAGQRITTIHLDGVQYFISRMNPYSPELNYFLAYQYCRSLGLQLASFETKEKAESMTTYLKNAGYGNYDFWTSGNRLGTGMFLWMSTGLPFNATFDFFENTIDSIQAGLLDPVDHNSNTSPQRTARDSSGAEKGCVILKQPTLKWMPEDCSAVKDFICEQTRCYYYNYGSIPVSSAQGRPITTTTPRSNIADSVQSESKITTTPLPLLMSSYASSKKSNQPSYVSLKLDQERALESSLEKDSHQEQQSASFERDEHEDEETEHDEEEEEEVSNSAGVDESVQARVLANEEADHELEEVSGQQSQEASGEQHDDDSGDHEDSHDQELEEEEDKSEAQHDDNNSSSDKQTLSHEEEEEEPVNNSAAPASKEKSAEVYETANSDNEMPGVEVRLKQISQEVEKRASEENRHIPSLTPDLDDIGHQSFLSLTDLIRTLRPNDKQIIPQIDSDYSNAMRVLGEKSVVVSSSGNTNE
ncbi:narrow isoform X2 [Musca autumnalis]|uniref:narrow isoform X2 n=1 Tax=Musca autumnalis TaxID=221902 RepID=UPI003CF8A8A7